VTFSNVNQFVFDGSLSNFSGSISFGGTSANYQFNNTTNKPGSGNPCTGSALASFDLGTGFNTLSNLNGGGLTYFLGSLAGGPNTTLGGRDTNSATLPTTSTYNIGANGNSTTFSGKIADGISDSVTVIKSGTGSLFLNGNSTYTGSTTVSNGVLGGTGSIASALTVVPGGTLSEGASIGTFTVNNNVLLGGAVLMKLNQANPGKTNDLLVVTGTLTGGGTLTVTNAGPVLTNGATFTLFSKPVSGFANITLPTAGLGTYVWTTNLAVNGSITLVSGGVVPYTVNQTSTNIVTTVTNGTLTLTWPADHIGWRLQVQTNPLTVGFYTNWYTVTGSSTTDSVNAVMNPAIGSVFYRLVYP
jgi:autotransporter-associated beta strand protein